MLSNIKIERFKNIVEIDIDLKGINLLIGANNSGKSSVLQAMQFAVSIAQSTKQQGALWSKKNDRCPSSLSSETLIYSPLKDIDALAPNGKLHTQEEKCISVTFTDNTISTVTIRKGKNKNITTVIEGKILGEKLQDIEKPYSMFVPGLAGIPAFEEYKPPSVVRKAAAKGDCNSVFRNVLFLLSKNPESWDLFKRKFNSVFPDYDISVKFDPNVDEHINVKVINNLVSLPIDSCGTGILQSIQILAYYYLYKPMVLILDEPDSHLHPNNQRTLAGLLKELHQETGCQIIISTHSKHLLEELKTDAGVFWINNCKLVKGYEDFERNMLLEIGALDKGDLLRNGDISCVLLTEDSDVEYIKILAESSGFKPKEFQIWSYNGCSNINVALALNSFILDHAAGTHVVVHRDRDYMTDIEVMDYKQSLEAVGLKVFVTKGNDAESHFVNADHVFSLYPDIQRQDLEELIDSIILERKDDILEKYINTIHNRRLQDSYKLGGVRPNPGAISRECNNNFDRNPRAFMHGKIVERGLRNKLQRQIGGDIKLCKVTGEICDPTLSLYADIIWPN
ncbi:TPA: AAA family ATPase [Raoultella planticola]|nr:AAA family ATPase [Raoultella planticola]